MLTPPPVEVLAALASNTAMFSAVSALKRMRDRVENYLEHSPLADPVRREWWTRWLSYDTPHWRRALADPKDCGWAWSVCFMVEGWIAGACLRDLEALPSLWSIETVSDAWSQGFLVRLGPEPEGRYLTLAADGGWMEILVAEEPDPAPVEGA